MIDKSKEPLLLNSKSLIHPIIVEDADRYFAKVAYNKEHRVFYIYSNILGLVASSESEKLIETHINDSVQHLVISMKEFDDKIQHGLIKEC